jgi:HK97 family phage prohead protease
MGKVKKPEQVKEIAGAEIVHKDAVSTESFDNEQSIIGWGSKPTMDRDKELILPNAWKLDNYQKNPVLLLSHKYDVPPVGKVLWIKADANGLKFKAKFASTERGKELYQLYKEGIMNAFSVGFTPNKNGYVDNPTEKEYQGTGLKRVYKDVELLEISCVAIPANSGALVEYVKSGKIKTKQLQEELEHVIEIEGLTTKEVEDVISKDADPIEKEIVEVVTNKIEDKEIEDVEIKGVISYKDLGMADEGTSWDGAGNADVDVLKEICTWYDSEKPDVKSSYKLPHHDPSSKKAVWRGVAAAMAACNGARGGVDIPSGDMAGVKAHLEKHYKQFGKEVPKDFDDAVLKEIFPEDYAEKEISAEEKFDNLNQVIKLLSTQIEELQSKIDTKPEETKVLSPEGIPSLFDITNAINNELRNTDPDQSMDDAETNDTGNAGGMQNEIMQEIRQVIDIFPTEYPNGSIIYGCFTGDPDDTEFCQVSYTYDIATGEVTFGDDCKLVVQSWVADKYNLEGKEFDIPIIKEGRVLSGSNRTLISNCVEVLTNALSSLKNLLNATTQKEASMDDEEDDDVDYDEEDTKSIDYEIELEGDLHPEQKAVEEDDGIEIDEEALTNVLTKMTKTFVDELNVNETVTNAFKKIRGKVI